MNCSIWRMEPGDSHVVGDYELFERIGKGTFASVWVGRDRSTGSPVAVKQFSLVNASQDLIVGMEREIEILKITDHPFIASLYDVIRTERNVYLVMEYVEEGTLLEMVNREGPIDEGTARLIFSQLVSVLNYLHYEKQIVHRDLKAENILLDRNRNIRIIDFGLSNIINDSSPLLHTACGSPAYVAPEMLLDQPYAQSADIWSSGVLLYAITTRSLPFEDENMGRLINKVLNEEPVYPAAFSRHLSDLLHKMLTKDPSQRITLDGIKTHPWFTMDQLAAVQYNFDAPDKYRMCQRMQIFTADPEIAERLEQFGIDTSHLEEDMREGNETRATSAYKVLFRDQVTDNMECIRYEMVVQREPVMSGSTVSIGMRQQIALRALGEGANFTESQIRGTKKPPCNSGSLPTINRIPSRGANGMQLVNLIHPNVSGKAQTLRMRSVNGTGKPHVYVFKKQKPMAPIPRKM